MNPLIQSIIRLVVKNTPSDTVKNTCEIYGVREYWTPCEKDAMKAACVSNGVVLIIPESYGLIYKVEYEIPVR